MKRLFLIVALAGLMGCGAHITTPTPPKTPLQMAVVVEADIADTVGELQTSLIKGYQQGLIPEATVSSIMTVSMKIILADQQATHITQGLTELTPAQRTNIWNLFAPISASVNDSINSGLIPIKDAKTSATIQASLIALQVILANLQASMVTN